MKIKYFTPLVLAIEVNGKEADLIDEDKIRAKIKLRTDEFLIYFQQQDGVEVTARFTK